MQETTDTTDETMSLRDACRHGKLDQVVYLLARNNQVVCDNIIEETDANDATPLHHAIRGGHLEIVKYLIEEGDANMDAEDEDGYAAIHLAIYWEQPPIVKYLLDHQHDYLELSAITNRGYTPLHVAVREGQLQCAKWLLEDHEVDLEETDYQYWTPLHHAAKQGNMDIIKYLIDEKGADIDATNDDEYTMLHMAADWRNMNVVRYLVEKHNMDPNEGSENGWKPIHLAVKEEHLEMVKFFIEECGVNVHTRQDHGYEPIHIAAIENVVGIAKYLIEEQQAHEEPHDQHGFTPMHCAASKGSLQVMKYLIEDRQLNPLCRDFESWTPLHVACRDGQLDIIKYLLEERHSSDAVVCVEGRYPLHFACLNGQLDVAKYFVEQRSASLDVKDVGGATPLHLACLGGHLNVVEYLIDEMQVSTEEKDNDGWTSLHCASNKGHCDIVDYLLEGHKADARALVEATNQTAIHLNLVGDADLELIKSLVKHGADACCSPTTTATLDPTPENVLHLAIQNSHLYIVKYLVEEQEADVNISNDQGYGALHVAIDENEAKIFDYLVNGHDVDVDAVDKNGRTPMHLAALNGWDVMVRVLLDKGATPFAADDDSNTPIHLTDDIDVMRVLVAWCNNDDDDDNRTEIRASCSDVRTKMLFARNNMDRTPHDVAVARVMNESADSSWFTDDYQAAADFLYSFVAPLAVGCDDDDDEALKPNPKLDQDQLERAQVIFNMVEQTPVHFVGHRVSGFLCLSDIMDVMEEIETT